MSADSITVVIVDDHEVVRQGIEAFLDSQSDLRVIGSTGSGAEALALVMEHAPQVAFVDLIMPEMNGVELTRRIKAVSPTTQVVVLTSFDSCENIFPALRAGALSYLLKDVTADELANAARLASRGEAVFHPRVAAQVMRELRGQRLDQPNPFVELTARELEVLELIADGQNNTAIAEALFISQKTVKRHVSNILSKLHLSDRTQAAVLAWREGLVRRS